MNVRTGLLSLTAAGAAGVFLFSATGVSTGFTADVDGAVSITGAYVPPSPAAVACATGTLTVKKGGNSPASQFSCDNAGGDPAAHVQLSVVNADSVDLSQFHLTVTETSADIDLSSLRYDLGPAGAGLDGHLQLKSDGKYGGEGFTLTYTLTLVPPSASSASAAVSSGSTPGTLPQSKTSGEFTG